MSSLPFLYERMFGPLPYAEDGVELFRVLESLPVLAQTSDPNNLDKTVLRRAQSEQGGTRTCHEGCWACKEIVIRQSSTPISHFFIHCNISPVMVFTQVLQAAVWT